ncbi:MAG: hypothetical protein IPM03_01775 [Sulfuritalea sp.]|nr:hypothetical protein [Sulfuritalea sp.]
MAVLLERMLMNDPLARPSMGEVAAQLQHLTAQLHLGDLLYELVWQ